MKRRPHPGASVRLAAAACLLTAGAVAARTGWGDPAWWAAPVLAVAVALSALAVVHLQVARQRWSFSLDEAVIGAALVYAVGGWAVVGVAAGIAVAQAVRRQPLLKLQYNVAQVAVSTAAAQLVAAHTGGGTTGACLGIAAFWALNHVLVALALSLTSEHRLVALVLSSAPISALHTAGNASVGLLAAYLARTAPLGLLGLLVPLVLLWTSYDQQTRRSAEARLFAELARGQEQATGRSADASASVVLTTAARLFGGADVEMVLLAPDGPVRYAGDEHGEPSRVRVDPHAFDEPWVLRALGAGRISSGTEDGRPFWSAVLGPPGSPLAVLVARRSAVATGFGRRELRLAKVLVGQAEAWLSVSDLAAKHRAAQEQAAAAGGAALALGDLGARTTPALAVLRDSAGRLARLAETGTDVDDIVQELHLVERAVASLLGAVSLAAERDLVQGANLGPAAPSRASADWTTTGVLS